MPAAALSVPHYKQEWPYSCVAACVRLVLAHYGQLRTEEEAKHVFLLDRFGGVVKRCLNILVSQMRIIVVRKSWGIYNLGFSGNPDSHSLRPPADGSGRFFSCSCTQAASSFDRAGVSGRV